ncbi:unnamed protein product [Lampetra fluviatilis]
MELDAESVARRLFRAQLLLLCLTQTTAMFGHFVSSFYLPLLRWRLRCVRARRRLLLLSEARARRVAARVALGPGAGGAGPGAGGAGPGADRGAERDEAAAEAAGRSSRRGVPGSGPRSRLGRRRGQEASRRRGGRGGPSVARGTRDGAGTAGLGWARNGARSRDGVRAAWGPGASQDGAASPLGACGAAQ